MHVQFATDAFQCIQLTYYTLNTVYMAMLCNLDYENIVRNIIM